jgi:hypothetical protein
MTETSPLHTGASSSTGTGLCLVGLAPYLQSSNIYERLYAKQALLHLDAKVSTEKGHDSCTRARPSTLCQFLRCLLTESALLKNICESLDQNV